MRKVKLGILIISLFCLSGFSTPHYLFIPSINLGEPLVMARYIDGKTWIVPDNTVGWGEHGITNMVLMAHNPGKFSRLPEMKIGDPLYVDGIAYQVQARIVITSSADQGKYAHLTYFNGPERVTLITCIGRGWLVLVAYPSK